ncbi:DUF5959 family protein [Streptomyces odonnellii]|uniref:DUF5959 family protein n=1 Tax=Streptomyces odonnellii TaxID=1417980 RepID=UPI000A40AA7D|nr:DUF5959 family protein [Streptomyces odonnellii]
MEDELGELIYLADPPGTSGHVVSLRVLEVPSPGRDFLDCEFVAETETVKGSFPVHVTSDDLDDWEQALGGARGESVRVVAELGTDGAVQDQTGEPWCDRGVSP